METEVISRRIATLFLEQIFEQIAREKGIEASRQIEHETDTREECGLDE